MGAAFSALEQSPLPPLDLTFDTLNCFHDSIWYLSPAPNGRLLAGQAQLERVLRQEGFLLEERPYTPHLTLGRRIILHEGAQAGGRLPHPIQARSGPAQLFLSHRAEGKLTYTPLHP